MSADSHHPEERYFPLGILDTNPHSDKFKRDWYSKFLKAMNESPFMQLVIEHREIYRFLWLRTFHRPIAIRLEKREDQCRLVAKELDGRGGYEPGTIFNERSRSITGREWNKFISLLQDAHYWEAQTDTMGLAVDGALWLLESYHSSEYRVVNRHCPKADSINAGFRVACLYLLALSGIQVAPGEVY